MGEAIDLQRREFTCDEPGLHLLFTGIVLVLRTFSRVRKGESVGVILETTITPAETT